MTEEYERCRKCGKLVRVIRRGDKRYTVDPKKIWAVPANRVDVENIVKETGVLFKGIHQSTVWNIPTDFDVLDTFVRKDGTRFKGIDPDMGDEIVMAEEGYRLHRNTCRGDA